MFIGKNAASMLALAGDARKEVKTAWFTITNKASGPTQVHVYDEIGMWGVSASQFTADLNGISGPIDLHLSSPGGEVFDGIAIYNALRAHGNITVYVDSLAASIASVIAMAADPGQLFIEDTARIMIHDGFAMAAGNAAELSSLVEQLNSASDTIASIYATRSGKPQADWRAAMQKETWYTGKEAVAAGLADKVISGGKIPDDENASILVDFFRSSFRNANNGYVMRDGKWVFDPDGDGDNDATAAGDTDHDYFDANGKQIKSIPPDPDGKQGKPLAPGNVADVAWLNDAKYKQADRDKMASNGQAMPDGSYPIADADDLDNAIKAVGRGGADHNDIRKHVMKRAAALGLSSKIPDSWNSDGSLKTSSPDDVIDGALLLALFSSGLEGAR